VLRGKTVAGRDSVMTAHCSDQREIRAIYHGNYQYIFSPWSNGKRKFPVPRDLSTLAIEEAAKQGDSKLAQRINHLRYRVPQELYDFKNDPDALHNLADDPAHRETLQRMQNLMLANMKSVNDPVLADFKRHLNPMRRYASFIVGGVLAGMVIALVLYRRRKPADASLPSTDKDESQDDPKPTV